LDRLSEILRGVGAEVYISIMVIKGLVKKGGRGRRGY